MLTMTFDEYDQLQARFKEETEKIFSEEIFLSENLPEISDLVYLLQTNAPCAVEYLIWLMEAINVTQEKPHVTPEEKQAYQYLKTKINNLLCENLELVDSIDQIEQGREDDDHNPS